MPKGAVKETNWAAMFSGGRSMKVRCPICNGSGIVEPSFGNWDTKLPSAHGVSSAKQCPGCMGTGVQETCGGEQK